jgi:signal transduction histidine kinase
MIDLRHTLDTSPSRPAQTLFRFALEHNLGKIASRRKLLHHFVEAVQLGLGARCAFLYRIKGRAGGGEMQRRPLVVGEAPGHDPALVAAFVAQERPSLPNDLLLAPVTVHGRRMAVVGAEGGEDFPRGTGYELTRLAAILAGQLTHRDEVQGREILGRIKEEVLRELRPKDLAYQILEGLRQLVGYDHSSALLLYDEAVRTFRVEAEKTAWGPSPSIGIARPASEILVAELRSRATRSEEAVILEPQGELAAVLAYLDEGEQRLPRITSTLAAPLVFHGQLLGLLRIAACDRRPFDRRDAQVVSGFLLATANALANARERVDHERRALEAAQDGHLLGVARVVAHDLNNAIGTILPLAEQALADLAANRLQPEELQGDLEEILAKAQLSKTIFSRLLQQAGERHSQHLSADLNRTVRERLELLETALRRRGATLELCLAEGLPKARIYRQNLEHVILNLLTNALDALPIQEGGQITVSTEVVIDRPENGDGDGDGVPRLRLTVNDNGSGIPEAIRERVFEPFFTTKGSTGLGLPLCQRLLEESQGVIVLDSTPQQGTAVRVELPTVQEGEAP